MKKNKNPKKPPDVHPRAQVIVTGKPITPSQALKVLAGIEQSSLKNWCSIDGTIGHLDSIQPNTSFDKLYSDLENLSRFDFLELGVSLMSGPPGSFVAPIVSFLVKEGTCVKQNDVHFGHPPPKRLKA